MRNYFSSDAAIARVSARQKTGNCPSPYDADGFAYFVLVVTLRLWSAFTVCQSFLVSPLYHLHPFPR
jgi:hypothetical protein